MSELRPSQDTIHFDPHSRAKGVAPTRAFRPTLATALTPEFEISPAVDEAIELANTHKLLPIGLLAKFQLRAKWAFGEFQKRMSNLEGSGEPQAQTAGGWWFWRIIEDWRQTQKEHRQNTLVGASGCWYESAWLKEPKPIGEKTQLASVIAQTALGLAAAREEMFEKLRTLYYGENNNGYDMFILAKFRADSLLLEKFKRNKALKAGKFENRFDFELFTGDGKMDRSRWLGAVAKGGLKEWGVGFPVDGEGFVIRTAKDVNTIAVRVAESAAHGQIRWRTMWLPIPEPTPDIHLPTYVHRMAQAFLTSGATSWGEATPYPLFEIVVPKAAADTAEMVDLETVASRVPVARITLGNTKGNINRLTWTFPHLTANERQGWDVIKSTLTRLNVELTVPPEKLTQPEVISRRYYSFSRKKQLRDGHGRRYENPLKEVEAVAGFTFTPAELELIRLAQTSLPGKKIRFMEIVGLAQTLISEGSVYFCIDTKQELQIGLLPSGNVQEQKIAFRQWVHSFPQVLQLAMTRYSPSTLRAVLATWYRSSDEFPKALQKFRDNFHKLTDYVNSEIDRGRQGKGVISVLDTYIPKLGKFFFRKLAAEATKVFERGAAQISSVDHGVGQPINFVTAMSAFAKNGLGVCSYTDTQGQTHRQLTYRWRAESDDLQYLLSHYRGDEAPVETILENAVRNEVSKRLGELRQNIALLSLLIVATEEPEKVLTFTGKPHPVFKRFLAAWEKIAAEQNDDGTSPLPTP